MSKKNLYTKPKRRRVVFSLKSSDAKEVLLMGDFNGWDPRKHPMRKDENGIWRKITYVYPGRYEYIFRVDENWQLDPEGTQSCMNCYGTYNSVIVVGQEPLSG